MHGNIDRQQAVYDMNAIDVALDSNWRELLLRETPALNKPSAGTGRQDGMKPQNEGE